MMRQQDRLWLHTHRDDKPMKIYIFIIVLFVLPNIGSCSDQSVAGEDYFTRQVIHQFSEQSKIQIDEKSIHANDDLAKQRIEFLNKDFKTDSFNNAASVSYLNYLSAEDNERIHLGVIGLSFHSCNELNQSYLSVTSSNRSNFMVKVLTRFIVLKRDKSLIFIYSETPFHGEVRSFMKTANNIEESRVNCID